MHGLRAARVALALALLSGTAGADALEVAKKAFERGVELEKQGDYAGALHKFREAEQVKATAGVRFHEAYALEMLGRLAAAKTAYERALDTAKTQGKRDVLAAVQARLEPLRPRVPRLAIRVRTTAAAAEVTLDGEAVTSADSASEPLLVDPGEHVVVARAHGRELTRKFVAEEGMVSTVDLDVDAEPRAASPSVAVLRPPPPRPAAQPRRTLAFATAAGALLTAGGATLAFVLAGSAQDDARLECPTRTQCEDRRDTVRALDGAALAGFVVAAGLAVLSVVLWTRSPAPAPALRTVSVSTAGVF